MHRGRRSALIATTVVVVATALGSATVLAQVGAEGVDFSAVAGTELTTRVATFASGGIAEDFDVQIDWGDGSAPSEGTVTEFTDGCAFPDLTCFEVRGTHTYASPGSYLVETDIAGPDGGAGTQSTATVTAPPGPPPPPPPPRPPVQASLQVTQGGGGLVILNAGASTGDISGYLFDLDGNGSHETECKGPTASALYGSTGPKTISVKVVTPSGGSSTASQGVNATSGGVALSAVKAVGACDFKAATDVLTCPETLSFGVAELSFPANAPEDACFKFARLSANQLLGVGSFDPKATLPTWRSPETEAILVNGLLLRPGAAGHHFAATASPSAKRLIGLRSSQTKVKLKLPILRGGKGSVSLRSGAATTHLLVGTEVEPIDWDVSKSGVVQTVPLSFGYLGGLQLAEVDSKLTLTSAAGFSLPVRLEFPIKTLDQVLSGLGITSSQFTLTGANTGDQFGPFKTTFVDSIPIESLFTIEDLSLTYSSPGGADVWEGGMKAAFPLSGGSFEVGGKARFVNGSLEGASITGVLPGLGIPLGCCIYLKELNAGFDEFEISGGAKFIVPPEIIDWWLLEANTTVSVSYVTSSVKAKGTFSAVGFPIGSADLFATPGFLWAQGILDPDFGPFSVDIGVQLYIGIKKGWYADAFGSACFDYIDGACITVGGAASSKAVTVCGSAFGVFALGGYYKWSGSVGIYFECSHGKLKSVAGVAQDGAAVRRLRVPPGQRRLLFRFRGSDAAPRLAVTTPDGRRLTSPDTTRSSTDRSRYLWIVDGNDTYLMLNRPPAGTWRVEEQPGSAAIASIARADPLPSRPVTARVSGRGHRRTLRYRVKRVPGQRVTFFESGGREGPSKRIGVARGRRGSIRFSPAEGPAGTRRIEAQLESSGLPRDNVTVARYGAPGPLRPDRPRLRVRRRGQSLVLRWPRVRRAALYWISVRSQAGGGRTFRTRRRTLRVRGVDPRSGATVRVWALSRTGVRGRTARARVKAAGPLRVRKPSLLALLRRGALVARCTSTADGTCALTLLRGRRMVGRGAASVRNGRAKAVRVRLTRRGRATLRRARRGRITLRLRAALPGEGDRTLRLALR